ncbi:hypothetical protein ADK91_02910 [Streptomyces sp. XY511]|uniref:DUF397 domain-containing protein n=1 Tax=Streptomyces sp. XY511 TaxID=1519480 RepID=UPI0006AFDB81|nr:DUF397 domain-containing protein [Streptomyces sp. XY511]KOV17259.1 hypothetical protein ADK91_02910 [Streptomyces sp. XY511]
MTPSAPTSAELAAAPWRTSSYSAANNECVEVGPLGAWVGLRDSKRPHGDTVAVPATAFVAMVDAVRSGAF